MQRASRGVGHGSPEPRLFHVAAHTISQNACVNSTRLQALLAVPGGWWAYQEMQTEVPVVMDRHYLGLKLNTAAKSSMKRNIFNKCVKQAVL